jgi:hypothetical protein
LFEIVHKSLGIAAPLAIIIGVIIALLQFHSQNRLRQLEIVMRLYSTFGQESFTRHYNRIANWDYNTYAEYRQKGDSDDAIALFVVGVFFENMGLLLKRKLAPIELLDDLLSSPILEAWPKVSPVAVGMREEYNHPAWFEWFEYLHDAMARRMIQLNESHSFKKPGSNEKLQNKEEIYEHTTSPSQNFT